MMQFIYYTYVRIEGFVDLSAYMQRSGLLSNSKALIIIFIFFNPKI